MKRLKKKIFEYNVLFEKHDGVYIVTVPSLPGLVTEGKNLADAVYMAKDAIKCYLEAILKEKIFNPPSRKMINRRIKISAEPRLHYA